MPHVSPAFQSRIHNVTSKDGRHISCWQLAFLLVALMSGLSACSKSETPKAADSQKTEDAMPSTTETEASASGPNLSLRLKVGDKFPLLKTIITTVVQPGDNGSEKSTAAKEFLLTVTVEAMPNSGPRAGQKQMGVRFHAVKFTREINGEKLVYDSRTAKEPLPMIVRPYHGLVNNHFSFWLGTENQIEGIVEFKEFLERCLKDVPTDKHEEVWNDLESQSGVYGIANFVDDSIGLLPTSQVKTGDSWTVTRQTQQPVPMVCKNRYTLQHLDDKQAEVAILGNILPAAFSIDAIPQAAQTGVQLSIQGGKATGSCTIDLRTGLPIHSQVEQFIDMQVKLKGGQEFIQHKQTITTIRAFPNSGDAIAEDDIQGRPRTRTNARVHGDTAEKSTTRPLRLASPGNRTPR